MENAPFCKWWEYTFLQRLTKRAHRETLKNDVKQCTLARVHRFRNRLHPPYSLHFWTKTPYSCNMENAPFCKWWEYTFLQRLTKRAHRKTLKNDVKQRTLVVRVKLALRKRAHWICTIFSKFWVFWQIFNLRWRVEGEQESLSNTIVFLLVFYAFKHESTRKQIFRKRFFMKCPR